MKKYSLIRAVFTLVTASTITLSFAACGASSGGSVAQTNSSAAYDAAYEEEIGVEAPAEEAMISENKVNPDTAGTALSEGISQMKARHYEEQGDFKELKRVVLVYSIPSRQFVKWKLLTF